VGMHVPEAIWETELHGMTVWSSGDFGLPPKRDMSIVNPGEIGWLLEGTGFTDTLPGILAYFASGNRGVTRPNQGFDLLDTAMSRTPAGTIPWAVYAAPDARNWWDAQPGEHRSVWDLDPEGFAMCTLRETSAGGTVVGLTNQSVLQAHAGKPGYERLFQNILDELTLPTPTVQPVPGLGALATGAVGLALAESGRRLLR